jgi:hypothetical protein
LNVTEALLLTYPHFHPTPRFISITVNSVLLITLQLSIQLKERFYDWHSNIVTYVSQSKFVTYRACQLRNDFIFERSTRVTLITKITHYYTIMLSNAQTEYCGTITQIWACPRANTTTAFVLVLCLNHHPYTHTVINVVSIRGTFQAFHSLISQTFRMHKKTRQCVKFVLSHAYGYLNTHLIRVYSFSRHLETARRPDPS